MDDNLIKQVGGVWFPKTEEHFIEMMKPGTKRFRRINDRWTYQYHKLERSVNALPKDRRRTCIDVGAHCGLWSMWLVRFFRDVEAFEPVPLHADLFKMNVGLDRGCWKLHRIALGNKTGVISIETAGDQTGSAHVVGIPGDSRGSGGEMITYKDIEMRNLDSYDFQDVDYIKIDVEGFEYEVVTGAQDTLSTWKPMIVIEQKGNEMNYGQARNLASNWLKNKLGYRDIKVMAGDHIMVCD